MRCNILLGLGCFLLALAVAPASDKALSATATTQFQVTANVLVACTIAATDLNFGDYTTFKVNMYSQITVTCTNTAQWNIGLNEGTCPGATVATRCMTGPAPFKLNYNIFTDGSGARVWGNTVGTDTVSGTGTGGVQIINPYGVIFENQDVGPGGYVDTITATITF